MESTECVSIIVKAPLFSLKAGLSAHTEVIIPASNKGMRVKTAKSRNLTLYAMLLLGRIAFFNN